mgnify:CR=1 FL=1
MTVSKALEISIPATRDLSAGKECLRPSRVLCMSEVSSVVVEWSARKPFRSEERGRKGTSLSKILDGVQSKDIDLQEGASVEDWPGFGTGIREASFQRAGIPFNLTDRLTRTVSDRIAWGTRCFKRASHR